MFLAKNKILWLLKNVKFWQKDRRQFSRSWKMWSCMLKFIMRRIIDRMASKRLYRNWVQKLTIFFYGNDWNLYDETKISKLCILSNTTHVVFKDGRLSTYKKAKLLNIPIVSILWIEACRCEVRLCNTMNYQISNRALYDARAAKSKVIILNLKLIPLF